MALPRHAGNIHVAVPQVLSSAFGYGYEASALSYMPPRGDYILKIEGRPSPKVIADPPRLGILIYLPAPSALEGVQFTSAETAKGS